MHVPMRIEVPLLTLIASLAVGCWPASRRPPLSPERGLYRASQVDSRPLPVVVPCAPHDGTVIEWIFDRDELFLTPSAARSGRWERRQRVTTRRVPESAAAAGHPGADTTMFAAGREPLSLGFYTVEGSELTLFSDSSMTPDGVRTTAIYMRGTWQPGELRLQDVTLTCPSGEGPIHGRPPMPRFTYSPS
jgi:hypothetical protein